MKEVKTSTFTISFIALCTLVLSSCVPNVGTVSRTRNTTNAITGTVDVPLYQGRILADNPIILSNDPNLSATYDLNKLLSTAPITTNAFLKGNQSCNGLDFCFEVRENNQSPSALQSANGKWTFNATSVEFLQVNTFFHINAVTDLFFTNLTRSFSLDYLARSFYDSALPHSIQSIANPNKFNLITQPLIAYANCDVADNAFFDRTTQSLCMGYMSQFPTVKWAQDSSAIYHETGHFLQKLQLNLRNPIIGPQVDMGNFSYDEAGSIGEGLSDYYSYYVNGRTHFAEWGAGRFLNASRPISERDPMHVPGISTDPDQRLSYPQFIGYDPVNPTLPVEDIHYSGMIVSHYLVALTEDLQAKCLMPKKDAADFVIHIISETLAEHGDLSSNGTEKIVSRNKINLNDAHSADWFRLVNPITYRSFMQTFAKNLMNNLSNSSLARCNNGIYSKDQIESLIDQYGLLLFRTYNENRNLQTVIGPGGLPIPAVNTAVNSVNRKKSVLVSKNLLILDPTANASSAFVIDKREQILAVLSSLQKGNIFGKLSDQTPSDLGFNNDNGKMSPGEVVAVALNLFNNSNTTMAGIQILANDWNHADAQGHPYQFPTDMSNDQTPLISEGATAYPCTTTPCTLDANGKKIFAPIAAAAATDFAPVCFIQSNETTATKWVSQSEFQTKMALDSSFCLDPLKTNECFIRAVKGADQAIYSKINSKSTWGKTLADPKTGKAPQLSDGNIILFEVSKHIPPGTVVDCRLRVRFTNCEDCYHDANRNNYDYLDKEYNGPRPFKIIHLQIPITD